MKESFKRIADAIQCDSVGIEKGEYVARLRFDSVPINCVDPFLAERVEKAYPGVRVLGFGVYFSSVEKPTSTFEHSHWFVRFTV